MNAKFLETYDIWNVLDLPDVLSAIAPTRSSTRLGTIPSFRIKLSIIFHATSRQLTVELYISAKIIIFYIWDQEVYYSLSLGVISEINLAETLKNIFAIRYSRLSIYLLKIFATLTFCDVLAILAMQITQNIAPTINAHRYALRTRGTRETLMQEEKIRTPEINRCLRSLRELVCSLLSAFVNSGIIFRARRASDDRRAEAESNI